MSEENKRTIIVLWGAHRNPLTERDRDVPNNVDKGVRELIERGNDVISLYPLQMRSSLMRWLLGQRGVYRTTTLAVVRIARATRGVIYTSSVDWARKIAQLKQRGVLTNRLVVRWAGLDTDVTAISDGSPEGLADAEVLRQAEVCLLASVTFQKQLLGALPQVAPKLQFWPTGVDTEYYRSVNHSKSVADTWDVAAIGSDNKRDWMIPFNLAKRGLRVALITEDAKVQELVRQLNINVSLHFRVGFAESAKVMAASKCVLISTLPNNRFSGSTTVGVAAALAKPLVLDDEGESASYGLIPGQNCELFKRGDIDSALCAIRSILDNRVHEESLARNIAVLAPRLDLKEYTIALEKCFSDNWCRDDFRP